MLQDTPEDIKKMHIKSWKDFQKFNNMTPKQRSAELSI